MLSLQVKSFSRNPMAKKSMVEREKKRARLRQKYEVKRAELKEQFRTAEDFEEKLAIHQKLQELPRNSAPSRHRNRCLTTGRPRGYYRDFGLSRNVLREWAHQGLLPGVVKSSW
jgi:small subunit ribosomal protein S14